MDQETAKKIADSVVGLLSPYCERIEIAGSIRRQKPEVGDIEIVAIPMLAVFEIIGRRQDSPASCRARN